MWGRKHTTQRKWQTLDVVSYNWSIERSNFELEPQRKKTETKRFKLSINQKYGFTSKTTLDTSNPVLKTFAIYKKGFSCS